MCIIITTKVLISYLGVTSKKHRNFGVNYKFSFCFWPLGKVIRGSSHRNRLTVFFSMTSKSPRLRSVVFVRIGTVTVQKLCTGARSKDPTTCVLNSTFFHSALNLCFLAAGAWSKLYFANCLLVSRGTSHAGDIDSFPLRLAVENATSSLVVCNFRSGLM